jgi:hypothetical protein
MTTPYTTLERLYDRAIIEHRERHSWFTGYICDTLHAALNAMEKEAAKAQPPQTDPAEDTRLDLEQIHKEFGQETYITYQNSRKGLFPAPDGGKRGKRIVWQRATVEKHFAGQKQAAEKKPARNTRNLLSKARKK